MERKNFPMEVKAAGDEGSFTALASVFGNVDLVGDKMLPGAFTKTLEDWRTSGDPIPVILSHQHDDPMALIGKADPNDVIETDEGLLVRGQLDISDNPTAKQVHKLMKDRLLKGWSFAYSVPKDGQKRGKDGVNEVSEVKLVETGPTLVGANPEATLQAVKAVAEDPGEEADDLLDGIIVLAQAFIDKESDPKDVATMRAIVERLTALASTEDTEDTTSTNQRSAEIEDRKDEEPQVAKSGRQDPLAPIKRDLMLARLGR